MNPLTRNCHRECPWRSFGPYRTRLSFLLEILSQLNISLLSPYLPIYLPPSLAPHLLPSSPPYLPTSLSRCLSTSISTNTPIHVPTRRFRNWPACPQDSSYRSRGAWLKWIARRWRCRPSLYPKVPRQMRQA